MKKRFASLEEWQASMEPAKTKGKKTKQVTARPAPPCETPISNKLPQEDDSTLFLAAVAAVPPLGKKNTNKFFQTLTPKIQSALNKDKHLTADPTMHVKEQVPTPEASQPQTTETAPEENLFNKAMKGVQPITAKGRDIAIPAPSRKKNTSADAQKNLEELLHSIEFALHHTDEYIEGFVVGIDPLVFSKLKAGHYSPEAHIDLHGKNALQAYDALIHFIKHAYQRNLRNVIVVTGRGRNSPEGVGIIRNQLQDWLSRDPFKRVVLAFCTAQPHDGGTGAVYVLLRKFKKSQGKIRWERNPAMDFPT